MLQNNFTQTNINRKQLLTLLGAKLPHICCSMMHSLSPKYIISYYDGGSLLNSNNWKKHHKWPKGWLLIICGCKMWYTLRLEGIYVIIIATYWLLFILFVVCTFVYNVYSLQFEGNKISVLKNILLVHFLNSKMI